MVKPYIHTLVFGLALAFSWQGAVNARQASGVADEARQNVASVRTDGGVIMVSAETGPFNTAEPNQPVASGDRLMVAKDSIATVIYDDGCEQVYDKDGIYVIEPNCKRAIAWTQGWSNGQVAAAVIGGAALGAAIDHSLRDKCRPVSR